MGVEELIHGGFMIGDLWVPNQFTIIGIQQVIQAAFRQVPLDWYVGMCAHNQADSISLVNIQEPSGANGYARQHLEGDETNWPNIGVVNNESYIESRPFTFPGPGPYDLATNRMFLTDGSQVIAISSPRPEGLSTDPLPDNTRYRLYFR